jgi:hypothetical protein
MVSIAEVSLARDGRLHAHGIRIIESMTSGLIVLILHFVFLVIFIVFVLM